MKQVLKGLLVVGLLVALIFGACTWWVIPILQVT